MRSRPGGVGHHHIDGVPARGVGGREEVPVCPLDPSLKVGAGERAKHVGRDSGVVDVGARGNVEKTFCEAEGKGVSHRVDEDVGDT